ncbi:hypothetical protein QUF82_03875 [Thiotrichales bacterium HSG14]|nr:hypothetical protein [Thiotrichales bacterium HSG14]
MSINQEDLMAFVIYGCVTTGSVWKFLQLNDKMIQIDDKEYYLDQLPKILGIFLESVSHYSS